jgi:hypothetical protein
MEDIGVMTMGFYRECTDSYMTVGVPSIVSRMMVTEDSEEPLLIWAETLFPEWEMGLDTLEFIPLEDFQQGLSDLGCPEE